VNTLTAALVVRITRLIVIVIAIGLVLPTPLPVRAAGIRYAVSDGATSGTCERWANACTLKYALSIAVSGDQIWVQRGVHYPGATQYDSFVLKGGVAVYGGFDGTETNFDQRNPSRNKTILSGDVDRNDNDRDRNGIIELIKGEYNDGRNANYVVMVREPGAVLDGFIITAGVGAYGSTYGNLGGGMYSSAAVTVASCIFVGNGADSGGGMAAIGNSPVLRNVMFIGNQARWGGGMYNEYSSPQLINVVFSGNIATIAGGGMYNHFSSPTLTNVTFSENSIQSRDGGWGGGMYNSYSSNPTLRNVIMWLNRATNSPEIFNGPNSLSSLTAISRVALSRTDGFPNAAQMAATIKTLTRVLGGPWGSIASQAPWTMTCTCYLNPPPLTPEIMLLSRQGSPPIWMAIRAL
jgi:Chlamydia polymorphic membrane protein (Chlamydia_PMP).